MQTYFPLVHTIVVFDITPSHEKQGEGHPVHNHHVAVTALAGTHLVLPTPSTGCSVVADRLDNFPKGNHSAHHRPSTPRLSIHLSPLKSFAAVPAPIHRHAVIIAHTPLPLPYVSRCIQALLPNPDGLPSTAALLSSVSCSGLSSATAWWDTRSVIHEFSTVAHRIVFQH